MSCGARSRAYNYRKVKCIVERCKNLADKKTPEGDPVYRTHLARINMFGSLDTPSPTIKSIGRGDIERKGFSYISPNHERTMGAMLNSRRERIPDKFRKPYLDFKKDSK